MKQWRERVKNWLAFVMVLCLVLVTGCSYPKVVEEQGASYSGSSNKAASDVPEATQEKTDKQKKEANDGKEQKEFADWCREQFTDTLKQAGTLNLHYTLNHPEEYGIEEDERDISFGELSVEELKNNSRENRKTYKELNGFSYGALSKEQQLTYDIVKYYLEFAMEEEGFELYNQLLSPDLGVPANVPVELAEYPLHSKKDVVTYLTLLTKLPEYFEQLATFEQQVAEEKLFISDETLDETIKQMEAFIETPDSNFLITTFAERLEEIGQLSKKEQKRLEQENEQRVKQYVIPAYEQLIKRLEALRGSGTNDGGLCGYSKGREYYELLVKYYTCSDMSVKEVEDMLDSRLNSLMERLTALIIKHPSLIDDMDTITCSMTEPDEILNYLKEAMKEYFPECPEVTYTVKYVDESLAESLSPAFYMVPQIDNYKKNTIYINNKSSNYDPSGLFSTLAHEGFPGHLYQTTYYNSTNPEPIRQVLNFGGYSEGWATYVELSSFELYDFGENSDAVADVNQINTELSLALSSMADIGVNYHDWDKSKLKEFLQDYGMDDDETVNSLYRLVVEDPGNYLQYYVSYLEFWQLRCRAKSQLKDKFHCKDFHKVVLDCGPSPFPVLEKQVEEYIDAFMAQN